MAPKALINWHINRLAREYGEKDLDPVGQRPKVIDTLVLTILSQNTNDVNRDRAYKALRERFNTWEEVMNGDIRAVKSAIKVGGLANQKAERIKGLLKGVFKERGELDFEFVCRMDLDKARDYLRSIKGIGEKTAAIALLFCCGMPAFPVDTHVHRISGRLGLIEGGTTAEKAHQVLAEMTPGNKMYEFHINLIEHGRKVCHARKPDCPACCLKEKCQFYQTK